MKMDESINTDSYLSFKLRNEIFAVHVSKVLEILEIPSITKVPGAPPYMTGVINLRGNVLPVVDTRKKFGMESAEHTINTCIVVFTTEINHEAVTVGALVDAVQEVLEISEEEILPSPSIGNKFRSEFIKGIGKVNEQFIIILNIDQVFSSDELLELQNIAE